MLVDDNGNLTDDATRVLVWDAFNRLVAVARKSDGAAIAAYSYLPDGRRSRKVVFSQTNPGVVEREVRFAWDGAQEVEEQNAAGVTLATFVWSPVYVDELVEFRREAAHPLGAGSFYAHQDVRCDVVAVTNASGVVVEKRRYDDFGREEIRDAGGAVVAASPSGLEYGFQGRRRDAETGWLYFRARSYDPETGRFLSRDPVWDASNVGGWYTFVGNGPLSGRDPSGCLAWFVIPLIVIVETYLIDQGVQEYTDYNDGVSTLRSQGESLGLAGVSGATAVAAPPLFGALGGGTGVTSTLLAGGTTGLFLGVPGEAATSAILTGQPQVTPQGALASTLLGTGGAAVGLGAQGAANRWPVLNKNLPSPYTYLRDRYRGLDPSKLEVVHRGPGGTPCPPPVDPTITQAMTPDEVAALLADVKPGSTFSGVYNRGTGEFVMKPSEGFTLTSGKPVEGIVARGGGHADVNAQLNRGLGRSAEQVEGSVGFSMTVQEGGGVNFQFRSGVVNEPQWGARMEVRGLDSRTAPDEIAVGVEKALRSALGF